MDYAGILLCRRGYEEGEGEEALKTVPEDESIVFLSKSSSWNEIKINLGSAEPMMRHANGK